MLEGSILHKLATAHQVGQAGKRPLNFGVYYKNTLVALCHALEDYILSAGSAPLVITAFQQGKWYLQEADRYGDIAQRANQIVIMAAADGGFAAHPTSQRSNVALVNLDSADPVAQEWHLMILSPTYAAMVLCQELSAADYGANGVPTSDLERKFYGFWTFEPGLVQETMELTIAHIQQYNPVLHGTLLTHLHQVTQPTDAQRDDLGSVVSRVVDYLQHSHADLSHPSHYVPTHEQGLENNLISNEMQAFLRIAQIIDQTDLSNPRAAAEVATLAEMMGQLLDLPAWQLHRLRLAGLLHRLSLWQTGENLLSSGTSARYQDAPSCPLTCSLVPGTQVLRTMPQLRAIATIVTHLNERWDGFGQPASLVGDEIPLESRILGLIASFQQCVVRRQLEQDASDSDLNESLEQALAECRGQQGTGPTKGDRWDPKLVESLALLVYGLQQGIGLPATSPKIAAGMWLLDSHSSEDLFALLDKSPVEAGIPTIEAIYGY